MPPMPVNASRTSYNIHDNDWDDDLLTLFGVPRNRWSRTVVIAADFGTDGDLIGAAFTYRGVAGDQQAAAIGQGCLHPGH